MLDVLGGNKSLFPPLGLQTVAALLPTDWEKRLVDLNVMKLTDSDLAWADYVFISAMIVQKESVYEVVTRCKKFGLKVVAGGPLFTVSYDQFEEIDCFVLNEGELTLPSFISDLEQGKLQRVYSTTNYAELNKSPIPQWDIVDLENYWQIGIQYSRGCPYKCEFCNITALLGHQMRVKEAEQVIAELDILFDLGWRKPVFLLMIILLEIKDGLKMNCCRY